MSLLKELDGANGSQNYKYLAPQEPGIGTIDCRMNLFAILCREVNYLIEPVFSGRGL